MSFHVSFFLRMYTRLCLYSSIKKAHLCVSIYLIENSYLTDFCNHLCVYQLYTLFCLSDVHILVFMICTHFCDYLMYTHCCVLLIHTYVINRLDTHLCLTDIHTFQFTSKYTPLCLTAYTHIYVYFYIIIFA